MNKNKSTYSKKDFKKEFARLMSRASISSSLSQEEGVKVIRGLNDFVQPYIPERLFRYRNCSELAFDAFEKTYCTPLLRMSLMILMTAFSGMIKRN